jgi:hypothetical protein
MPEQQTKLTQLRDYTRLQVRAGLLAPVALREDVEAAISAELGTSADAASLAESWLAAESASLQGEQGRWDSPTDYDRLVGAFGELAGLGVVVLHAVEDHWAASFELDRLAAAGQRPAGIAWFTAPDVWHAIDHGMFELNVWHGDTANVAPGDQLLDLVLEVLGRHGLPAHFDEGRIEVAARWLRRLPAAV